MSDPIQSLKELIEGRKKPDDAKLIDLLEARRVKRGKRPAKIPPAFTIGAVPIAKPGDLTVLIAQAKSGKTAFVNGIIAAAICSDSGEEADTLGVTAAARPPGSVVIWFDTEQSEEDAWLNLDRAARRALSGDDPDWIRSYFLVGESPNVLRAALLAETKRLREANTPVWFVVLDGIADFCQDPNDLGEAQEVVTEARAVARDNLAPVFTVIHRNEGDKADSTPRGHLGKELIRKASCLLWMDKVDEVSTVWSTKSRGAPILRSDGPRFRWCDKAQMHITVHAAETARMSKKTKALHILADALRILDEGAQANYSQLCAEVAKVDDISNESARRRITDMITAGILRNSGKGMYMRA